MVADSKTTALSVYERIQNPVEAVQVFGNAIAKSRMFGCENVEAGQVFAWECLARRTPPLMLAERYHVIYGKLSMKAEAMLAGFLAEGGKYKVLSRTPDLVAVEMQINDGTHNLSLSWEDVQKEPFAYTGKEEAVVERLLKGERPPLKAKYATPRSRMQMMWARLVSDSVRFLAPQVVSGVYTPEEIEDFRDSGKTVEATAVNPSAARVASVVDQAAAAAANGTAEAGEVVDAEFEIKAETPPAATTTATTTTQASDSPELATEYQIARIKELSVLLACGAKVEAACQKRGCNSVRSLRKEDAGEMLEKLEANYAAKRQAETPPFDADKPEPAADTTPCGPMTDRQFEAINKAMGEFAQIDPAGKQQFLENLKAWLASKGLKLRQIDATQAAQLCDAIRQKSLPTFIRMDLEKHAGEPGK